MKEETEQSLNALITECHELLKKEERSDTVAEGDAITQIAKVLDVLTKASQEMVLGFLMQRYGSRCGLNIHHVDVAACLLKNTTDACRKMVDEAKADVVKSKQDH